MKLICSTSTWLSITRRGVRRSAVSPKRFGCHCLYQRRHWCCQVASTPPWGVGRRGLIDHFSPRDATASSGP